MGSPLTIHNVISKPGLRDKPNHPNENLEMKEFSELTSCLSGRWVDQTGEIPLRHLDLDRCDQDSGTESLASQHPEAIPRIATRRSAQLRD